MKFVRGKKRIFVIAALALVSTIGYGCSYFVYAIHVDFRMWALSTGLNDLRLAFHEYHVLHHCWPDRMSQIYGMKTSDGIPVDDGYVRGMGGTIENVAAKAVYCDHYDSKKVKVLLIAVPYYRTRLWPFGDVKAVVATTSGVAYLAPSQLHGMSADEKLH